MVSVIRQSSMPSMPSVASNLAPAATWPRPTVVNGGPAVEHRMVSSSVAAPVACSSPQLTGPPLSSASMSLASSNLRPFPTMCPIAQRPSSASTTAGPSSVSMAQLSASTVGQSSVVRQHSHVERQQSTTGLHQQQRTVSFRPEPTANGEKVVHLLSADMVGVSSPATARGSSPSRLISAPLPGSTVGNVVLPGMLQTRTPPVPFPSSALLMDGIPHSYQPPLLSQRGDVALRGDGTVHSYPGPGHLPRSHAGIVSWVNGVGVTSTGVHQDLREKAALATHANNLLSSPRGRADSPVRNSRQGSRSNSPRRAASAPRTKQQQLHADRAPESAHRLYQDAVARRERLREKKQQKELQQQQALEEGQRNFTTRHRENQRFYRFRDSRTHEEREEAMLRRRAERVRELKHEQKQRELEKYSECTFQPHIFTRGRENRHAKCDVRASSSGSIAGQLVHDDVRLQRCADDTPRNHLRPSFVEDSFNEGEVADEDPQGMEQAAKQLHSLPECGMDMDICLSSANDWSKIFEGLNGLRVHA